MHAVCTLRSGHVAGDLGHRIPPSVCSGGAGRPRAVLAGAPALRLCYALVGGGAPHRGGSPVSRTRVEPRGYEGFPRPRSSPSPYGTVITLRVFLLTEKHKNLFFRHFVCETAKTTFLSSVMAGRLLGHLFTPQESAYLRSIVYSEDRE